MTFDQVRAYAWRAGLEAANTEADNILEEQRDDR